MSPTFHFDIIHTEVIEMLTKEQEKVLKYLLNSKSNSDNKIIVQRSNYILTDIPECDFVKTIKYLAENNYLKLYQNVPRCDDLTYYIEIVLLEKGTGYFNRKVAEKKKINRERIRTFVPILISTIALLKSFDEEIIWLWKQLMQLWK